MIVCGVIRTMEIEMKILETALKHRAYDDMWMLLGKTPDYENSYRHRNEDNKMTTLTPDIWIILDVQADRNKLRMKKGKLA